MKKRFIMSIAVTIILGSCIICFFWIKQWKSSYPNYHLCIKGSYFEEVPISESPTHTPCIEIEVEGKKIKGEIDLGSSSIFALPKIFLAKLNQKSFLKQVSYYGIRGKKYYSDLYEIPRIQIGGITIHKVRAKEINTKFNNDSDLSNEKNSDQDLARIGWGLFSLLNVFLDCENGTLAFCDSLDTLKNHGYPVDSFVETPISLDRNLIEFEVKTHKGKIRCVLDTGCTLNMLNKDLENKSNKHMIFNPDNINRHEVLNPSNSDLSVIELKNQYDIPVFKIGKKDFGKTTFTKIKIPLEIDAFIGMEFLRSKLVFIDFPNSKAYFYDKRK